MPRLHEKRYELVVLVEPVETVAVNVDEDNVLLVVVAVNDVDVVGGLLKHSQSSSSDTYKLLQASKTGLFCAMKSWHCS